MTAESSVMPTVIVAVIDSGSKQSLQEEEERPWRPRLKIISVSKAENKKKMAQTVAYKECSE